jgi:hypothetical protein
MSESIYHDKKCITHNNVKCYIPVGFYVYAYLRNSDSYTGRAGTPYYIGKGKGRRAWAKHTVSIPTNMANIIFLETNLTNVGASAIERRLIKWYGRIDLGTGILRNRTAGGDGGNGGAVRGQISPFKGKTHTPEIRQQISNSRKGQKTSRVYTELSDETKQKLSIAKKGKIVDKTYTEEYRKNNSVRSYNNGFNKITSGTVWINNGKNNKRIKPDQLENYPGFILGRLIIKNHIS